jgi:NhaP-type Na+/H+ or K+/H+ antiporter
MFFTRIGKVIAHLIFWGSIVRLASALFVALNTADMEGNQAAAARYLSAATSGDAMDEAVVGLLLGLALGVLCEISTRTGWSDRA